MLLSFLVKDLQYVDDASLVADSEAGLQQIINRLTGTVSTWGTFPCHAENQDHVQTFS